MAHLAQGMIQFRVWGLGLGLKAWAWALGSRFRFRGITPNDGASNGKDNGT